MKIYRSTEYIAPTEEKAGNLKLEVISMWDWKSKPTCFGEATSLGKTHTISYKLKTCVEVKDSGATVWKPVESVSDEMKEELINDGYVLSRS